MKFHFYRIFFTFAWFASNVFEFLIRHFHSLMPQLFCFDRRNSELFRKKWGAIIIFHQNCPVKNMGLEFSRLFKFITTSSFIKTKGSNIVHLEFIHKINQESVLLAFVQSTRWILGIACEILPKHNGTILNWCDNLLPTSPFHASTEMVSYSDRNSLTCQSSLRREHLSHLYLVSR